MANVFLNVYAGLETPPVKTSNNRYTENGMFCFVEPPMGSEVLTPDASTAATSAAATAPAKCSLLRVQPAQGTMLAYRVTKSGQSLVAATANDARIRGDTHISFGAGDRFSCIVVTE